MNRVIRPAESGAFLSPEQYGQTAWMLEALLSLPRPIYEVEALLAMPGQGETERISVPIQHWQQPNRGSLKHLLIGGLNLNEKTAEHPTVERLQRKPFFLKLTPDVHIDGHRENTKTQADWLAARMKHLRITSACLFLPPYHMLRAYLTLLKSLEDCGMHARLYPVPILTNPFAISPESGEMLQDLMLGDLARLPVYQEKGDVATFEEFADYLKWLHAVWQG